MTAAASTGSTAFGPQSPNYTTTRPPFDPVLSGAVDTFFKNCSASGSSDGTYATADFFNVVLQNLRMAVRTAGIPLDGTNDLMLYEAIQAIAEVGVTLGGGLALDANDDFLLAVGKNLTADNRASLAAGDVLPLGRAADGTTVGVLVSALASYVINNLPESVQLTQGDGITTASGKIALNFAALTDDETVQDADVWARYSASDQGHRRSNSLGIAAYLAKFFQPSFTSAAAYLASFGITTNQPIQSQQVNIVGLTGAITSFCYPAPVALGFYENGTVSISAEISGKTFQPSGELQYVSIIFYHNGTVFFQDIVSYLSYGEVDFNVSLSTTFPVSAGDSFQVGIYTHSQNNDDTGDYIDGAAVYVTKVV